MELDSDTESVGIKEQKLNQMHLVIQEQMKPH